MDYINIDVNTYYKIIILHSHTHLGVLAIKYQSVLNRPVIVSE